MKTEALSLSSLLENAKINSKENDYSYRSGWNPSIVMGQQYILDGSEAKALVRAIAESPADEKKALLAELLQRTKSTDNVGSVALDAAAACALNQVARTVGLEGRFESGQRPPIHPVG